MKLYPFIEAEKTEQRSVKRACDLLKVSRTAFYQWSKHIPSARTCSNAALLEKIIEVHKASKGRYGSPRVHRRLQDDGVVCGHNRVASLMRANSLVGRAPKRFRRTTIPNPDASSTAVDLVKRVFGPETLELNTLWASDITYIRTWEGWLYLATVIDVASRRVVGWAMADHMRTELVSDALRMAIDVRHPADGLIFHSDRGCQYTSDDFGDLLEQYGIRQSLSRPGQCWDNAVAESFFATLKTELVYTSTWATRSQARSAIFDFIEGWYNRVRLHSSLGYLSPVNYEARVKGLDAKSVKAA